MPAADVLNQLKGLWRDTWWLWLGFVAVTVAMSIVVGKFFLLILPCLPVVYVYFAMARYDEHGHEKPDLE